MIKKGFLTTLALTLALSIFAEIRSLWVVPWDVADRESIDAMIADAILAHQNEILIEVRYRSDAMYQTNRGGNRYPNPEPPSYIIKEDGFDPLGYAIEKAKPYGLKIQAWVVVFNATPTLQRYLDINYIYKHKSHWITWTQNSPMIDAKEQFGFFIDPGIPEVQEYLLDVFSDIVLGYPELDGLHLDYIRYPNLKLGYHPTSKARYQIAKIENRRLSWNDWRKSLVTDFVRDLRARIKTINPNILLTAAVFADLTDAHNAYAQEWDIWLQEGIIDIAYPMAYHLNFETFKKQMQRQEIAGYKDKIIVGLRAWDAGGKSLKAEICPKYNVYHIRDRIDFVRDEGFAGIALFSYSGIKLGDALDDLVALSYPSLSSQLPVLARFEQDQANAVIAAMQTSDTQEPQPGGSFDPAARMNREFGSYTLSMNLPFAGRWTWQVYSEDGTLLYSRKRSFKEGYNEDYWLGTFTDGSSVERTCYTLRFLFEDTTLESMVIPEE